MDARKKIVRDAYDRIAERTAAESLKLLRKAGFAVIEEETAGQDLAGEEGAPFLWVAARRA